MSKCNRVRRMFDKNIAAGCPTFYAFDASETMGIIMKKLFLLAVLIFGVNAFADDKSPNLFAQADKVVWSGIDYTHARFIGPGEFTEPQNIFPGMLDAWNDLVLKERLQIMEKELHKPVVIDISGMMKHNQSAGVSQIINEPGPDDTIENSHITPDTVSRAVRSYKLESSSGVAVVFIVDRFIKITKKGEGAVYVVAFDIASRDVIFSQRVTSPAAGFGFRNYWFRIIKNSEKALGKIH